MFCCSQQFSGDRTIAATAIQDFAVSVHDAGHVHKCSKIIGMNCMDFFISDYALVE